MPNFLEPLIQPVRMDAKDLTDKIRSAIKDAGSLSGGLKQLATNSAFMGGVTVAAFTAISAAAKRGVDQFVSLANEVRGVMQITGENADHRPQRPRGRRREAVRALGSGVDDYRRGHGRPAGAHLRRRC